MKKDVISTLILLGLAIIFVATLVILIILGVAKHDNELLLGGMFGGILMYVLLVWVNNSNSNRLE